MKNIYSTLLTASALLLAGSAHSQAYLKSNPGKFATVRPVHATSENRGGAPVNDDCSGATPHDLTIGTDLVITGDNTGGTDGEGFGFATTWEAFTLSTCANVSINYCGTNPVFGNFALGIGDCPLTSVVGVSTQEDCGDGNILLTYAEVPAGDWTIPVLVDTSATGPYTITVSATACASAPTNDDCASATSLTAGTTCAATSFTTAGADQTLDTIPCAGFTSPIARDVFFSFVATSATMTVGVTGYNAADAVIELFDGTCSSLNSLGCADATFPQSADEQTSEELIYDAFTVGQTYFVRVFDWGHASLEHNFDICVVQGSGSGIGMEEYTTSEWSVYPNPTAGMLNMNYVGVTGSGSIELLDLAGRIVFQHSARMVTNVPVTIDVAGVAAGNYTIRMSVNGQTTTQRLAVN